MLAGVAVEQFGLDADEWAEFGPFVAHVLAPERTLLEKLSALHTAAMLQSESLAKMGRHIYDVYQLLGSEQVLEALMTLGSEELRRSRPMFTSTAWRQRLTLSLGRPMVTRRPWRSIQRTAMSPARTRLSILWSTAMFPQ